MLISSFCSKPLIWVLVLFPSLLVPCTLSFISLSIAFTFSSNLWPYSTNFMSILITSVLTSASDGLAIHRLVVFFLERWCVLSFGPFFFVLAHLLHSKGWSLRCSPGRGNPRCCVVTLYVGEWSEKEQWHLLGSLTVFSHFLWYPEANWALLVLILKWVVLCTF